MSARFECKHESNGFCKLGQRCTCSDFTEAVTDPDGHYVKGSLNKKRGIYAGSFDPITLGHLDIINRSKGLFDELIIGVANNSKKNSHFSIEKRVELVKIAAPNVPVVAIDGMLAEYCNQADIGVIVRGLRSTIDFEYENAIAAVNLKFGVETIFINSMGSKYHISSSVVRELMKFKMDLKGYVPESIINQL